jgi:hypothetical protein
MSSFIICILNKILLGRCERKFVPLLNYLSTTPCRHMGEWRYSSTILDLGTRWRRVVSFTSRPLYPRGKRPQYPLDRKLVGPQSWSGCYGVKKSILPLSAIKPGRSDRSPSLHRQIYPSLGNYRITTKPRVIRNPWERTGCVSQKLRTLFVIRLILIKHKQLNSVTVT